MLYGDAAGHADQRAIPDVVKRIPAGQLVELHGGHTRGHRKHRRLLVSALQGAQRYFAAWTAVFLRDAEYLGRQRRRTARHREHGPDIVPVLLAVISWFDPNAPVQKLCAGAISLGREEGEICLPLKSSIDSREFIEPDRNPSRSRVTKVKPRDLKIRVNSAAICGVSA